MFLEILVDRSIPYLFLLFQECQIMRTGSSSLGTVAEQVAALPPLSKLLGITSSDEEGNSSIAVEELHSRLRLQLEVPLTQSSATPMRVKEKSDGDKSVSKALSVVQKKVDPAIRGWKTIQESLKLPLVYRDEAVVTETVAMLKTLPFMAPLVDSDLLTVAERMEIVDVRCSGVVILEKTPESGEVTPVEVQESILSHTGNPQTEAVEEATWCAEEPWNTPAATVFRCLRQQAERGLNPRIPSPTPITGDQSPTQDASRRSVGSRHHGHSGLDPVPPPTSTERPTVLAKTVDQAAENSLFHVDDSGVFVLILLRGQCQLRLPTPSPHDAAATRSYPVMPGDAMGYSLLWSALPLGSRYTTSECCSFLKVYCQKFEGDIYERLLRLFQRANNFVLEKQRNFLAHQLTIALFSPETGAEHPVSMLSHKSLLEEAEGSTPDIALSAAKEEETIENALETAACSVIPVRLSRNSLVIQEGELTGGGLYFLVDGLLTVLRSVHAADRARLEARRAQLCRRLGQPDRNSGQLDQLPSTDFMEMATLHPGEFCGELAVLRENPDITPSWDIIWNVSNWYSALAASKSAYRDDAARNVIPGSSAALPLHSSSVHSTGNDFHHRATVVTERASLLYCLLPTFFGEVLVPRVMVRLREFAKGYPSYLDVLQQYEKIYDWALYKEQVLLEVMPTHPSK